MNIEQPEDSIDSDLDELERDMQRVREKRRKVQELEEELDRELEDMQDLRQKRRGGDGSPGVAGLLSPQPGDRA